MNSVKTDTVNGIGGGLVYARNGVIVKTESISCNFNQYCQFNVICEDGSSSLNNIFVNRSPKSSVDNDAELVKIINNSNIFF